MQLVFYHLEDRSNKSPLSVCFVRDSEQKMPFFINIIWIHIDINHSRFNDTVFYIISEKTKPLENGATHT